MQPHPLDLGVAERALLVPDGVGHPEAAKVMDEPGQPDLPRSCLVQPECARRRPGKIGYAA